MDKTLMFLDVKCWTGVLQSFELLLLFRTVCIIVNPQNLLE